MVQAVVVQRFRAQQRRGCRGDAEVVGAGTEVQMCRCTVVLGAGMQGCSAEVVVQRWWKGSKKVVQRWCRGAEVQMSVGVEV
jgi:hypothetical protein